MANTVDCSMSTEERIGVQVGQNQAVLCRGIVVDHHLHFLHTHTTVSLPPFSSTIKPPPPSSFPFLPQLIEPFFGWLGIPVSQLSPEQIFVCLCLFVLFVCLCLFVCVCLCCLFVLFVCVVYLCCLFVLF